MVQTPCGLDGVAIQSIPILSFQDFLSFPTMSTIRFTPGTIRIAEDWTSFVQQAKKAEVYDKIYQAHRRLLVVKKVSQEKANNEIMGKYALAVEHGLWYLEKYGMTIYASHKLMEKLRKEGKTDEERHNTLKQLCK